MSTYNTSSVWPIALLLGAIMGGAAHSQGLPPPFTEYGAKFACGPEAADSDVVIGQYATSINIHNPQSKSTVSFLKKFVLASPEGTTPRPPVVKQDRLGPDLAEFVDCPIILAALKLKTGSHAEGFVVIEVATPTGTHPMLDVVGKYTARSRSGEVSSFDVVEYQKKSITSP